MDEKREHAIRRATPKERQQDCCGDRYESNIEFVCKCGEKLCRSCMSDHLIRAHRHG